jgi:hypothetical protein
MRSPPTDPWPGHSIHAGGTRMARSGSASASLARSSLGSLTGLTTVMAPMQSRMQCACCSDYRDAARVRSHVFQRPRRDEVGPPHLIAVRALLLKHAPCLKEPDNLGRPWDRTDPWPGGHVDLARASIRPWAGREQRQPHRDRCSRPRAPDRARPDPEVSDANCGSSP